MTKWNFDISEAPKGGLVTHEYTLKSGETRKRTDYETVKIWGASACGKVGVTYWIPPNQYTKGGRWSGYSEGDKPIAWMPYEVPTHPDSEAA